MRRALAALDGVLSQSPPPAGAHLQRGLLQLGRGDFNAAMLDLKQAIQEDPIDRTAHYNLARVYL